MIVQEPWRARLAQPSETARVDLPETAADVRLGGLLTGTCVLTPDGYRQVEQLRRGDLVATLMGHGPMFAPITWIGRRRVTHQGALVRVRRDAVNDGMPCRDVVLAEDHALYLDGTLYRARQLVNGVTLMWDLPSVSQPVWAIQVERHDVVVADGLAVETLLHPAARAAYAEMTAPRLHVVSETAV